VGGGGVGRGAERSISAQLEVCSCTSDGWMDTSPHNLLLGFKLDFSVVGLGAGGFGTVWGRTRVGLTQST
jgi:hypothetical protein